MRTALIATLFISACGPGKAGGTTNVPETMLPATVNKTPQQQFDLFLLGEQIGTEKFTLAKTTDGYRLDLEAMWRGERWNLAYDVNADWTTKNAVLEKPQQCTVRMYPTGGEVVQTVKRPGRDELVLTREPGEMGWYAIRPVVTQFGVCFRASDQPVSLRNFPGFHVELAPRVQTTLADGRIVDKIVVDELIDVFCKADDLVMVHYAKHGFLAVRPDYAVIGKDLAKNDPKDEPWASDFDCPEPKSAK